MEESRPGRRRSSPPPPHGARNGGADRISDLPEDLLLQVLVRLGCARTAARTGILSRRWTGLWTRLPEVTFRNVALHKLEAALARVARPAVSRLDIRVPDHHGLDAARVSSLLRAAARISPEEFDLTLLSDLKDPRQVVDLPFFGRATSINLDAWTLFCMQPPAGGFPKLERLSIRGCLFDIGALLPCCPCLRVLRVVTADSWSSAAGNITIHSASLQELFVEGEVLHIDIVAPVLKQLTLSVQTDEEHSLSISAPMVEKVWWRCLYVGRDVGFGTLWHLSHLALQDAENNGEEEDVCLQVQQLPRGHVLSLHIEAFNALPVEQDVAQEIAKLPVINFQILELGLTTRGHVFGPIVLHLLGITRIRTGTKKLKVVLRRTKVKECPVNCPCDKLLNWRSQSISLTDLEKVEIEGFKGGDHEVDFLNLLFRCAPLLKSMIVELSTPSNDGHKEIYNIFNKHPTVKCYAYLSSGSMRSSKS